MSRRLTLFALLLALLLGAAAAPAGARTFTQRAQAGVTQAEFSFDRHADFTYSNLHLSILRGGTIVFFGPVSDRCGRCPVQPAGGDQGGALAARDLDGGGEAEVVVDLFTGGAHCCTDSLIYRYEPFTNTYVPIFHGWGSRGYRIRDLQRDGVPEFVSADDRFTDDRFTDTFGPYAVSVAPERIWRLEAGRMVDVTRQFRSRLVRESRSLYAQFRRAVRKRQWLYGRNLLAAYTAEAYLSRRRRTADARVRAALRRHRLRKERGGDSWPAGRAYVRRLHRILRRYGYT